MNIYSSFNCTIYFIGGKAHAQFLLVWDYGSTYFIKQMAKILLLTPVLFLAAKETWGQNALEHIFSKRFKYFFRVHGESAKIIIF